MKMGKQIKDKRQKNKQTDDLRNEDILTSERLVKRNGKATKKYTEKKGT